MPGSIRLGRIGNTRIDVHLTFLPVLIWAAWLGIIQYGGLLGALFHILAVILLFGCVLLHEIAHSIYARSCGIEVGYIVLLPIGGLASMEAATLKPDDEIRIALAGPLVNVALGLSFGGIVVVSALQSQQTVTALVIAALRHPSLVGLLTYLAAANLLLGIFNLLPAYPLDGGRALRAVLSRRMSFDEATRYAAIAGRSFGAGLFAISIGLIMLGVLSYGLSLLLVAGLLYSSATQELRAVRRDMLLRTWTVGQVSHAADRTVEPHEALSSVLASLIKAPMVPVVLGEQLRLVGLITMQELRNLHGNRADLSIAHVMRTRFPTVRSGDPLWVAYEKLRRSELFAIPVVRDDTLCGLVTLADIRRVIQDGIPPAQP